MNSKSKFQTLLYKNSKILMTLLNMFQDPFGQLDKVIILFLNFVLIIFKKIINFNVILSILYKLAT
jgi:hypothetical protein